MPSVLGLFQSAETAAAAADRLQASGFGPTDYEVLTGAPYPEGAFGEDSGDHRLYIFPLGGAIIGFAVGLMVTAGTQLSFPLVTAGKPILGIPPMFIIMYEGTMLGALIFTIMGVIFESNGGGILGRGRLVVRCDDDAQADTAQSTLTDAGAEEVKQQGRS